MNTTPVRVTILADMEGKQRKAPARPGLNIPRRSGSANSDGSKAVTSHPVATEGIVNTTNEGLKVKDSKAQTPKLDTLKTSDKLIGKKSGRKSRWAAKRAKKLAAIRARKESLKKLNSDNWLESPSIKRAALMRPDEDDIGAIWKGQERIRQEEEALMREYEATKQKSKKLKKKIKEQNKNGDVLQLKHMLNPEVYEKVVVARTKAKKTAKVVEPYLLTIKKNTATGYRKLTGLQPRTYILLGVTCLVMGGAAFGVQAWQQRSHTKVSGVKIGDDKSASYQPTVPQTANSSSVIYNQESTAYTFKDTYQNVELVVTEQQLPERLKNDGAFDEMAKSAGASEAAEVDGTRFYVATTEDPLGVGQRVLFRTDKLLVFITAPSRFTSADWALYIANFKQS